MSLSILDSAGTTRNLKSTLADGAHATHHVIDGPTDAFSRVRVSEPRPIGDYNLHYGLEPLLFEEIKSGTGNTIAMEANTLMAKLTLGGTATGHAKLQTYQYHHYQPGRSHAVFLTGVFGLPVANTIKRIGYFDDYNGVFFQQDADGVWSFTIRSSTSGTVVDDTKPASEWSVQPDWIIDPEKNVIIAFDLQFLGMGMVRCFEDRNGVLVLLHEFRHEQEIAVPYMQTATLPVRTEIVQTTAAAAASMYFKCASVMTEGGTDDEAGLSFIFENTQTAGNGTAAHMMSIEPLATFGGLVNRTQIIPEAIDLIVTGNSAVKWELVIGQALSGTTAFTAANATHSAAGYNTAGTLSGSPTAIIAAGYVAASATVKNAATKKLTAKYPITLDAAGATRANGRLTLLVTGLSATSACRGIMAWREVR